MASILVVEDDVLIRLGILAVLEAAGHRCQGVGSRERALGALAEGAVDLVVLDWRLADGGCGRDVALAGFRQGIPVLVASATASETEARDVWATAVLPKPFTPHALRRAVELALQAGAFPPLPVMAGAVGSWAA
ncbi:response regulator [Aerophototrophica crusticola]|uniref:Response regulator n=1 Tax=Aerophototrophica crusticola TaxID=1709002 RepID=A0A858R475_9PROT|nr:response regulator [Rhodospirillaceae bacterium B3]